MHKFTNDLMQLLTFALDSEIYALEVPMVREVLEYSATTPIPQTPKWVRGVLSLRGSVVPVFDLKAKLEIGETAPSRDVCILILERVLRHDATILGVLADSVREVFEFEQSKLEPLPPLGAKIRADCVRGVGRRGNTLFVLLDIQRIFSGEEPEVERCLSVLPQAIQ